MSIKGEEFFFSLFYPFLNLYLKFGYYRHFLSLSLCILEYSFDICIRTMKVSDVAIEDVFF